MKRVRVDEASQPKMLERCVAQLAWLIWLTVSLSSLALEVQEWPQERFPIYKPFEHSLKSNLPAYVRNKLRGDVIHLLEQHNDIVDVIVVAIAGSHFDAYCESLGWRIENISKRRTELRLRQTLKLFDETEAVKQYNVVRPSAHIVTTKERTKHLVICVTPGHDFLKHMAQLIWFYLKSVNHSPPLIRFHSLSCTELVKQSDLHHVLDGRSQNAVVFLGCVQFISSFFRSQNGVKHIGKQTLGAPEHDHYGCDVLELEGRTLVFLGVKFPFWGEIAERLAESLFLEGAAVILYIAKLGVLTDETDIGHTLFVPHKFYMMSSDRRKGVAVGQDNCLSSLADGTDNVETNGAHISVPSIMDETSSRVNDWLPEILSVDNEASYIARAASKHQRKFGMAHYATDALQDYGPAVSDTTMLNVDQDEIRDTLIRACRLSLAFVKRFRPSLHTKTKVKRKKLEGPKEEGVSKPVVRRSRRIADKWRK